MAVAHIQLRLEQIVAEGPLAKPSSALIESLRRHGQRVFIRVRPLGDDRYELVRGADLLAVARALDLETINAVVETDEDAADLKDLQAMILHAQSKSLRTLALARHARRLVQAGHYTQAALAREMAMRPSTLCHMLRVVECPDLAAAVDEEALEWGAASDLAPLPPDDRAALLKELRAIRLATGDFPTIREVRRLIRRRTGSSLPDHVPPDVAVALLQKLKERGFHLRLELIDGKQTGHDGTLRVAGADLPWVLALLRQMDTAGGAHRGDAENTENAEGTGT